jgi:hypothetical protein
MENTDNYPPKKDICLNKQWKPGLEVATFPLRGISLDNERLKEYISKCYGSHKSDNICSLIDRITSLLEDINKELSYEGSTITYTIF